MIRLPRLLDSNMQEIARLEPVSLTLDLNMAPLSTASMTLPAEQEDVRTGAFIEIFTPYGSAGIFRVQQTAQSYGGTVTLSLEHGLVTLSDEIIPGVLDDAVTTPVKEALQAVLSQQSVWELGTVDVPDDVTLSWQYDYSNLLESLISIMDKLPAYMLTFDQSTLPWKLNVVAASNEVASECRLSRNISTLDVEEDRSELCTRLYIPDLEEPLEADTIGTWGAVTRSLMGDEGLTAEELKAYGQRYLEKHKNPALMVSIDAVDLHEATGDPMDAFSLGYLCRVCLPDFGRTINQRIITISYSDLIADDRNARLTLANAADTTADALAGLIVDTTVQRRLIYKNGQELIRLVVRTIANEKAIDIITPELNILSKEINTQADRITETVGDVEELHTTVTTEADGLRVIVQDGNNIISELKATIDGLENWVTDADGNVSELTNTVRGLESKVETAGGKVSVLTNTADGLTNTVFGQGGELSQLMTRADEIRAAVRDTNGSIGSLSVKSDSVTAKVKGVEGQVSQLAVTADGLNYTLTKHGQELSSIKALVDEISLTVTDTNGNMGTLITKSDSVTAKVSNVDGRVSQLAVTADGMAYTLTKQGQELSALRVLIDEISLAVKDTNGALGQLVVKSDSITGKVVSADERFSSKFEMLAGIINLETKADGTVVSVRMDAAENSIRLKADKTYVENLIADEISATNAQISNLTSGLTTAMVINSNWFNGTNAAITYLSADAFTHNGALVSQRSITMGSVTSAGKALSTGGELDLQHSHAVTVNDDGTITLGEVSAEGGNFKIADTKAYKDGVSAAKASVTLSAPNGWQNGRYVVEASNGKTHPVDLPSFSVSGGTAFDTNHKTTVYFSTPSVTGYLKSAEIDASGVYKNGWNECRAAMSRISNLYTISQNAPGTLYMLVNGNYTSVGSDWVKVSAYSNAYSRPAAIA